MRDSFQSFARTVASALMAATLALFAGCDYAPAPNGAYEASSTADCLPAVFLLDQNGNRVSMASFKGKSVLIDFVYTSCPGPCSVLTSKLVSVAQGLGPQLGKQGQMISITLEP